MEPVLKLYTLDEIADYLQLSREKVTKLIRDKKFPSHKIDKQWRFYIREVDEWVREQGNSVND